MFFNKIPNKIKKKCSNNNNNNPVSKKNSDATLRHHKKFNPEILFTARSFSFSLSSSAHDRKKKEIAFLFVIFLRARRPTIQRQLLNFSPYRHSRAAVPCARASTLPRRALVPRLCKILSRQRARARRLRVLVREVFVREARCVIALCTVRDGSSAFNLNNFSLVSVPLLIIIFYKSLCQRSSEWKI